MAAKAIFVMPDSEWVHGPSFCGTSGRIRIPAGARQLSTYLAGPVEVAFWCPSGTPAIKGVVTATFTSAKRS